MNALGNDGATSRFGDMKCIIERNCRTQLAVLLHLATTLLVGHLVCQGLNAAEIDDSAPPSLRAAFAHHCAVCHGEVKQEGELRLDALGDRQWRDLDLLDEVINRLEGGEMPPEDAETKLPDDLRRQMTSALKGRLSALEQTQLAGTLNRLTRREWCDTLEDITGIPVEKPYELPIDSSHAMGKLGEHQLLTPLAMRQYQQVANRYVNEVILDTLPEAQTQFVDFSKSENQIGNTKNETKPWGLLAHVSTNMSIRALVESTAREGEYEFKFDYYFTPREELENLEGGQKPKPTSKFDTNDEWVRFEGGGEILSKGSAVDLNGKKFHVSGRHIKYRMDEPIRVHLSKGKKPIVFRVKATRDPAWVITGVTIRGPVDKTYPPAHEKIFGDAKRDGDINECRRVLDSLATRLFRRPVDAEIMAIYYERAEDEYNAGGNLYSATKICMKAMLVSPYFLFKELGDQPLLDDYMIATRLSYFLWNTAPDEQLLALASDGKLSDAAVRRAQALRLLSDPDKSDRFVRLFVSQWLGLERFDDFIPNKAYIEERILNQVRPSIEQEPYAFFSELVRSNLSARNFIDSNFVVWDRRLVQYYGGKTLGIRDAKDDDFTRYELDRAPDEMRPRFGGLVTMPMVMSMTTDGEATQPILRGAWVVQHLFGEKIEPPDSVPALEVNLANVDKPKEILRLHKQDKSCYACHVKMDYMGLALENYDVMGRWQSNYLFPVIEGKKFELITKDPVDAQAETPDGKPVDGIAGLKAHMLQREDEILRNLIEKLFAYAIGREVRYRDRAAIAKLMESAKANDFKLRDMILDIVASDSFTHR